MRAARYRAGLGSPGPRAPPAGRSGSTRPVGRGGLAQMRRPQWGQGARPRSLHSALAMTSCQAGSASIGSIPTRKSKWREATLSQVDWVAGGQRERERGWLERLGRGQGVGGHAGQGLPGRRCPIGVRARSGSEVARTSACRGKWRRRLESDDGPARAVLERHHPWTCGVCVAGTVARARHKTAALAGFACGGRHVKWGEMPGPRPRRAVRNAQFGMKPPTVSRAARTNAGMPIPR